MISNGIQQVLAATLTAATETVEAILPQLPVFIPQSAGVRIRGYVNITTGATGGVLTIRVRKGTTTSGALVGVAATFTTIATEVYSIPFEAIDTSGTPVAGNQYCVTLNVTGSNATVNDVTLEMDELTPGGSPQ